MMCVSVVIENKTTKRHRSLIVSAERTHGGITRHTPVPQFTSTAPCQRIQETSPCHVDIFPAEGSIVLDTA